MSSYRITHIDIHRQRRRLHVQACNRQHAVAWVERLYGDAWYIAAARVIGSAADA